MRSKLYRNTKKFSLYTNKLYINIFSYKVLRDNFFISISDRAIFSNYIRSRRTNLCNFKNHCFFTSNGKSVYSDFLFSRFELKRRAMSGSIVGMKVASWLFFFICISFIPLLVCLIFVKILKLEQLQFLNLGLLGLFCCF